MTIEEIKATLQMLGHELLCFDVESHHSEEIVAKILSVETALWRARIQIERTYKH